ncbi:MAG: hypothetical protein ACOY0T_18560 [Myxococcota bacterium]
MQSWRIKACSLVLSLALGGCGGGAYVSSERQVLPSFQVGQFEKKRLFIAPYSVKVLDPERAVPLERDQMKELARAYKDRDPNRAALKAFYSMGADGARDKLKDLGLDLGVVDLPNGRWHDYFEDNERFLNVTVDGKLRYQVPDQKLLNDLGVQADFVVVLGALAYSMTHVYQRTGNVSHTSHSADFEGRFLVWDYAGSQVLAEGKIESSVGTRREASKEVLLDLGRAIIAEIVSKRPFRG